MSLFHLIWLIWGVTGGGQLLFAAANGCGITMPTDLPTSEPVLLYASSGSSPFSIWRPSGQQNQLPAGSRLLLLCAGNKNVISTLNQQVVELVCRADGSFATAIGNVQYTLSQLGCTSIPTADLRLTTEPCSNGQGYIYEAGFGFGAADFATVFTICYNNATEHTYYSHNAINGAAIDYKVIESTRRAFRANGMRFSTTAANTFYTTNNQIKRFEKYFGRSQPFINTTSYMARGHLTPDADFVFSFEQLATYFYTNVAPEFQVINAGNWIRVENLARSLASTLGGDLETYTGTMGLLHLSSGANKNVPIYLDPGQFIEAPLYYFKVIKHVPTDAAVVMITVNNPFAAPADIKELCDNVCERAGVANPIFADTTRGYTYCCELAAFKQIYADLPADLTASKLLNEAEGGGPTTRTRQAPPQTGCSITLPTDIPQYEPVYFLTTASQPNAQLWKPTGQMNVLPVGAQLTLACTGSGNTLKLLGQQSVVLTCRSDGTFNGNGKSQTYTLAQLGCESIPTSDLKLTTDVCGGSSTAHRFEAGYAWSTYFGSVFTICYDSSAEHTLYTRSIINGAALNYSVTESTRRNFRANGMRFTTKAVNNYYTRSNQVERFQHYFGTSQPYITTTSFLSRGHMTPDADFVFSYEQLATYFYTNTAPEFQVVNAGNWIRVENAARNMATSFGSDLLTFTGVLGILELPKSNNAMQAVYLDSGEFFPAPQWYYKVLMHPMLETSLVMITLNNPFANSADIVEFCPNVCADFGLDSPFFTDASRGYTFCCTLDEFEQAVPNLPTFDLPAGW